jgi:hypothetical protein
MEYFVIKTKKYNYDKLHNEYQFLEKPNSLKCLLIWEILQQAIISEEKRMAVINGRDLLSKLKSQIKKDI